MERSGTQSRRQHRGATGGGGYSLPEPALGSVGRGGSCCERRTGGRRLGGGQRGGHRQGASMRAYHPSRAPTWTTGGRVPEFGIGWVPVPGARQGGGGRPKRVVADGRRSGRSRSRRTRVRRSLSSPRLSAGWRVSDCSPPLERRRPARRRAPCRQPGGPPAPPGPGAGSASPALDVPTGTPHRNPRVLMDRSDAARRQRAHHRGYSRSHR
jgi:hypothetical protein